MPAAPSRKPPMPLDSTRRARLATDEQPSVDGGSLEEAEPVEPELRIGEHLRLWLGRVEDALDLVDGDRAVARDAFGGPGHALDEHLVGQRAQVAVAQPDVAAHTIVVSPIEGAAHVCRDRTQSCPVSACSRRLTDATLTQRIAPSSSGRVPVRRMPRTSAARPTPASATVISANAASESVRRASAPISPAVSRAEARTKSGRKRGTSRRGRPPDSRFHRAERPSTIGTMSVVRVSLTTIACDPAA